MNVTARDLGMTATRYTDPSRLAASTVSSAADQVVLGAAAMHQPALAAIAAMPSAVIPVAGLVRKPQHPARPGRDRRAQDRQRLRRRRMRPAGLLAERAR